ncbi:AN1-type zinc finger protein [Rhynchospora pubera]|uniref:AN1-type zinc finger protein n=1 Tax=Rhynchospora pubera TaxID=906938 RepID=A0AAV8DT53_9POAL|nr:AN1-type zinc finger protein [Rhynchospora pubera]
MGTPAFPNLGKHCSVEDCKQIDFLPFTCDRCNEVFCLQHRSYTTHQCPVANPHDVTVVICPLCAKSVRLIPNQDPNITWETHCNTDCDPSNYQKATTKRRCPVRGCKETLTFSNTIKCKDCLIDHCLKHRFGPDHKCPGPKKPESAFPFVGMLSRSQKNTNSNNSSSWWNTIRASAEASMQKLTIATNQAFSTGASSSGGGALVEQCTQCNARFANVSALIEHAERTHGKNSRVSQKPMVLDICPKCSKGFRDPVLLVEHVEREHGGSSTRR